MPTLLQVRRACPTAPQPCPLPGRWQLVCQSGAYARLHAAHFAARSPTDLPGVKPAMLSEADSAVVAREPGLPGLAVLLDPDRLLDELDRVLPGRRPVTATITYLRYKPGTSCLAGLRLETPDGTVELSAKAYRAETYAEASARTERPQLTTWLGPSCLRLDERLIIFRGFPHDRKLKALVRLFDAERGAALLRQMLPDRPDLCCSEIEIVRYKPERRLVAVLGQAGRPGASLKAYDKDDFGGADHDAFDGEGRLRLPQRLGRHPELRILVRDWLEGQSLHQLLSQPQFDPACCREVGAALADLHGQEGGALPERPSGADGEAARVAAAMVAKLLPDLSDRVCTLAASTASLLGSAPSRPKPVHGDFSAEQVIVGDGMPGVIDFDHASRGDAASDLGTFLAKVEAMTIDGLLDRSVAEATGAALWDGYRSESGALGWDQVRVHTALALLRLAPEKFRARMADWPMRTEMIIDRADALISSLRQAQTTAAATG
jgi:tRNA A-37 threonylcarbamoyl transferase component Bud32